MKKLLPKTTNNFQGFTLIELMVVVAIVAILSVIGISIFANAQKNAKDGIRRVEINSLAKSIESTQDPTTSKYTYTATNYGSDYPQNKPADPLKSATAPLYCIATSTTTAPPVDPIGWTDAIACPTGYTFLVNEVGAYNSVVLSNALNASPPTARSWKICARLEVSGLSFCKTNIQ